MKKRSATAVQIDEWRGAMVFINGLLPAIAWLVFFNVKLVVEQNNG
jgi:hypothetical protein